ncbi:hypothetical protein A2U01_0119195, partial [Trifolium medium]|nr:hypothetical protein [Trifolium medium]
MGERKNEGVVGERPEERWLELQEVGDGDEI